jgi:hypothetical protein
MAFDANQWRSERLRLLQKLQANIDTARWLREQSLRTLRQAVELMSVVDQARSERSFRDCDTNRGRFYSTASIRGAMAKPSAMSNDLLGAATRCHSRRVFAAIDWVNHPSRKGERTCNAAISHRIR